MSEPRMLDLGYGPAPDPPVEVRPVMVISTAQAFGGRPKATSDGQYTLNGSKFKIHAGDPLPDGAVFVPKEGATAPAEEAASAEEGATEPAKKSGKRGPSENTDATGPTETT